MRILFAVDMALLKPNGGGAEDKIGRTFYIAVLIILAAGFAVGKHQLVAIGFHRYRLPGGETGIVLKTDVIGPEMAGAD